MEKDKTIAIAFHIESKALAYEIWKRDNCTVEEATHKSFEILLPKYFKILEKKFKKDKK